MIQSTGKLLSYSDFRYFSPWLIETGAGGGDGIQRALDADFEHIISVEAYEPNYEVCARRFVDDKRVKLLRGTSAHWLAKVLAIAGQASVIVLDAHPSGPLSYGHKELSEGKIEFGQDSVLQTELNIILINLYRHLLILDDQNGRLEAEKYVEMIEQVHSGYKFYFYDEQHGSRFYKDKLLVAVP